MREIVEWFGGKLSMSRRMDVAPSAVSQWLRQGLPAKRALQIEELSRGKFRASEIVGSRWVEHE